MNERMLNMLRALSCVPIATLGPRDLLDADYAALVKNGYVEEYWGNAVVCAVTQKGRDEL